MLIKFSKLLNSTLLVVNVLASHVYSMNSNYNPSYQNMPNVFQYTFPNYTMYNPQIRPNLNAHNSIQNSFINNSINNNNQIMLLNNYNNNIAYNQNNIIQQSTTNNNSDKLSDIEKQLGLKISFQKLYQIITDPNTTIEEKNNCITKFWKTIQGEEYAILTILLQNGDADTLRNLEKILNVLEVQTCSTVFTAQHWQKFRASVDAMKAQCIDGTNVQIDYSFGFDQFAKENAAAQFYQDYGNFLSSYSWNTPEHTNAQNAAEEEMDVIIAQLNYISYDNPANKNLIESIINKLKDILKMNLPGNLLTTMQDNWSNIFEKAWIEQNPNNNGKK